MEIIDTVVSNFVSRTDEQILVKKDLGSIHTKLRPSLKCLKVKAKRMFLSSLNSKHLIGFTIICGILPESST